ncbi:MAG TPA: transcription-repair coupling factor [Abditibacteriaceae bacterium]
MQFLDLVASQFDFSKASQDSSVILHGTPSPSWATLAAALQNARGGHVLLIVPNSEAAENAASDLQAIFALSETTPPEVALFPIPDRAGFEEGTGDRGAVQDRLAVLDILHGTSPTVVVAPMNALAHPTLPPSELRHGYDVIAKGQTLERDEFIEHLSGTGYERMPQVEAPGHFAARGGLIDFFPPAAREAIRIELFGDEVDSIRCFDVDSQRSTTKLDNVRLTPPREIYLAPEKGRKIAVQLQDLLDEQAAELRRAGQLDEANQLVEAVRRDIQRLRQGVYFDGLDRYRALLYPQQPTLFDHLPPNSLVIWADPNRCQSQNTRLLEDDETTREAAITAGDALRLPAGPLVDFETLKKRANDFNQAEFHVAQDDEIQKPKFKSQNLDLHLPPVFGGKLDQLLEWVKAWQRRGGVVVLSSAHARRVREILADGDVRHVHLLDAVNEVQAGLVLVMGQRLSSGFSFGDLINQQTANNQHLAILTDSEMFGWRTEPVRLAAKRKSKKKREVTAKRGDSAALTDLGDLREGDYVVHINHGIARYGGVARREVAGAVNDYLLLEYDGTDRLYVPVSQLDRVQKYLGSGDAAPPLNSLKGNAWERTKKRVREETAQIAKQLAELYASREQAEKMPYPPDSPWQREMESAFPYEETPSQLQAIKDAKSDLENPKPMDRLVCGDVGYGKTEVAVRAAFKVAQEGRQVAVLVPTTVLAQQHYQTFAERLAPYPTRVEVMSRFRTPGELRKIADDVRLGAVDILIGTHRILSGDVQFRDLGLVVVDEEQRFGVLQKEKLKEMRSEVDILTLSATPIPRTLHFALGGLRELSLITDPPPGRLAVKTFIAPYKEDVVRQAIEREIEREGQVYYVHNRIQSIHHVAEHLRQLVPHARIGVGHGQMGDEQLEQVMLDFMHRRTDVLLSTTIIENGLDLPNVNTIIVDRSELLGLSQMYQLRGRVGRSPRQGYAYFFSGARGKLSVATEERFAALQENTDLGAGFKIAMRDMEIRGAGELLGAKQSGGIAQVGFELYAEMLSEAVKSLESNQKQKVRFRRESLPEADLPVAAFLPDDYVPQEGDRLHFYRKLSGVLTLDDVESLREELRDRFGALPQPAFNLIRVLKIRVQLLLARLRGISKSENEILIRLKIGDTFLNEDTTAVFTKLNQSQDKRNLQHISLRPREGIAISTRVLTPLQVLKMTEDICETLATVRGARFLGEG